MPWSNPKTWTVDEFVETSEMNTELRDNLNWLHDAQACIVLHSTTQLINNDTATNLVFDTEEIDTEGMHSVSTNTDRITIVTAGKYAIFAHVGWPANASGYRELYLTVNGNIFARQTGGAFAASTSFYQSVETGITLAATDIVRAGVVAGGVSLTLPASSNPGDAANKRFGVIRVG